MAGARHAARPRSGRAHLLANALCSAVVVVGVGALLLGGRASGSEATEPSGGVLATGTAVVPAGLFPGAVVTGHLPVSNSGSRAAQVTRIDFAPVIVDADHPGCRPGSVLLAVSALPVVPGAAAQSIPFTVTMDRAVGDECQGASFTSGYSITARAA